jgi:hypothetical protein
MKIGAERRVQTRNPRVNTNAGIRGGSNPRMRTPAEFYLATIPVLDLIASGRSA